MTQSSMYPEYVGPPLVVDGNADPDWHDGSCTAAGREDYPWISVDLGARYQVIWVTITNTRLDCE